MRPPAWEACHEQTCFRDDLFRFRPSIKILRFWGAKPGRGMGGERGICSTFHSHPWRSWVGRKNSLQVVFIGEKTRRGAMILALDIATVRELRHKCDQSFGSQCWQQGKGRGSCRMMGRSLPVGVLGAPAARWRHRAMAAGTMASGLGALRSGNAPAPMSCAPWAACLPTLGRSLALWNVRVWECKDLWTFTVLIFPGAGWGLAYLSEQWLLLVRFSGPQDAQNPENLKGAYSQETRPVPRGCSGPRLPGALFSTISLSCCQSWYRGGWSSFRCIVTKPGVASH